MAEVLLFVTAMSHLEPRMKRVLATQVALDRAGFSPGQIDAQSSANTERALRAFQQAHGLHVTGELDRKTVRTLGQPFVRSVRTYQITAGDLESALDWTSMVDMLAERFHTSPALLRYLNTQAMFEEGETLLVPNVESRGPRPVRSARRGDGGRARPHAERAERLRRGDLPRPADLARRATTRLRPSRRACRGSASAASGSPAGTRCGWRA